ncbi:MAG: hypothetical protein AB1774_06540 [Bacillota bacterium]
MENRSSVAQSQPAESRKIGVLPCSGACNVGMMTTRAVVEVASERPDVGFVCALVGFTLLISVALGAIVAPLYHQTGDMAQMWFYLCLSTVFLVLTVVHLKDLKIGGETA